MQGLPSPGSHEKGRAMHRWFRFCAVIALMASSQGSMAQSAPPENEVPASKHRLKATPTEILQHTIDEQGKKTEQLATQLSAQIEAQGKQLDDLAIIGAAAEQVFGLIVLARDGISHAQAFLATRPIKGQGHPFFGNPRFVLELDDIALGGAVEKNHRHREVGDVDFRGGVLLHGNGKDHLLADLMVRIVENPDPAE